jgi:hypothetical protein
VLHSHSVLTSPGLSGDMDLCLTSPDLFSATFLPSIDQKVGFDPSIPEI